MDLRVFTAKHDDTVKNIVYEFVLIVSCFCALLSLTKTG